MFPKEPAAELSLRPLLASPPPAAPAKPRHRQQASCRQTGQSRAGEHLPEPSGGATSKLHSFNAKAGDTVRVELNGKNPLAYLTLIQPDGKEMVPAHRNRPAAYLADGWPIQRQGIPIRDGAGSDGKPVDYRLRVLPVK